MSKLLQIRLLRAAALASIAFLPTATAHHARKSLGFGFSHPTSDYVTEPQIAPSFAAQADPLDVAHAFLQPYTDSDYFIRKDSYTDTNTGVTHVYVRQRIHGLEVADGDINLNIRDGRVLSFGDSFFRGPPSSSSTRPSTSHATYCGGIGNVHVASLAGDAQFVLADNNARRHWYDLHCARPLAAVQEAVGADLLKHKHDTRDPRRAALYFMITAQPDSSVAQDLARSFDATLDRMSVVYGHDPTGNPDHSSATISGLPGALNPVAARQVYVQTPASGNQTELHLTWRLEVEMSDNWYEAYVSVSDPSAIVSVVDWASDSPMPRPDGNMNALEAKLALGQPEGNAKSGSYYVWRWGVDNPASGNLTVQYAPHDMIASPLGWHTVSRANNPAGSPDWKGKHSGDDKAKYLNFTTTWGNNVFAQENWEGLGNWISNKRPDGGESLRFHFEYGVMDGFEKDPKEHVNLSVTQLFYTANMVHDLYYRYGFNESAGNFQQDNYGRGGRDNDAIIANTQDGSGFNNANFFTPPDGQNGRCRMYIWNTATPYRDGALEAGILIHELTHGLSGRLTGGPANSGCLVWGESGGMSEGWGDFFATTIRSTRGSDTFPMGDWASNQPEGVRGYPYSTASLDISINPSTYETLDGPDNWTLHAVGEVWAEILWVVSQRMVRKHGYSPTLFPPQPLDDGTFPGDFYRPRVQGKPLVPKHGNTLMVQLVIL
ncbi:unnamed protein product, partial [Rhizoctonia solani]